MAADKSPKPCNRAAAMSSKLPTLLLVLCTNMITVLLFTGPLQMNKQQQQLTPLMSSKVSIAEESHAEFSALAVQLNHTRRELGVLEAELTSSREENQNLKSHVENLALFLKTAFTDGQNSNEGSAATSSSSARISAATDIDSAEYRRWVEGKKLPLGFNPNFGSDTILPSVGRACEFLKDEIQNYMNYSPGGLCPDDEVSGQRLMLSGCEPLPRRRCFPRIPKNYREPDPYPRSLWNIPPDSSILWSAYSCKNYTCLVNRKYQKAFDDCKDCFDLQGRESTRWTHSLSAMDLSIDEVLALKKTKDGASTIRIGLDIGGGTGTFAVRMRERNITIVTTSMNFNGPFNNFIASRGVVPLYISISQRLPFFDGTLDIVHSMHVLSNWIPTDLLEFVFYDIYRVLRPGGIFWLDHFFCTEDQFTTYAPMIANMGFEKLKWAVAPKLDRGPELKEMYITAVLQKPTKTHSSLPR